MDTPLALAALSALSHESRLAAFRRLVEAGPAGMTVGDLRQTLGLPAATLTAHLNVLRQAQLVRDQREGRVIRVRANFDQMNALVAYLTANCCAGQIDCGVVPQCVPDPTGSDPAGHCSAC
ncbi:transcriptional regulator [Ahniella affigens]|uniref:Transcriptional regulator n=1 Tax=Ahniella affigens TaxID=2021234 RepID=A0A2P1PQN9_9GAMM|nr:metalloregulator ArsR/SmtB family transcription factor [Ahniella affigens]AVP97163.1 transcriptional regulator [Ahniella affigens]